MTIYTCELCDFVSDDLDKIYDHLVNKHNNHLAKLFIKENEPEKEFIMKVVHCNHCGCNIYEHGIIEEMLNCDAETTLLFGTSFQNTIFEPTLTSNADDNVSHCNNCNAMLFGGEVPAWSIIDFYIDETDYLQGYLEYMGGAPVHGW